MIHPLFLSPARGKAIPLALHSMLMGALLFLTTATVNTTMGDDPNTGLRAPAQELDIQGEVDWPTQWTVFAPLGEHEAAKPGQWLAAIPKTLEIPAENGQPARSVAPRKITVKPGQPTDLTALFGGVGVSRAAYIFTTIDSPEDQTVTLGMGADWWLQAWVNGEEVYNNLAQGNGTFPPTVMDHVVQVPLKEGSNLLVLRYITGRNKALVALGGPTELAAAARQQAIKQQGEDLNTLPVKFEDRLIFPVDQQAVITAGWTIPFPQPDADLSTGALVGLTPMPKRQLYLTAGGLHDTNHRRFSTPVRILLSKFRYPLEDRHLDAIVWTTHPDENAALAGELEVRLKTSGGEVLASHRIGAISPTGQFFSMGLPDSLAGAQASLEVLWRDGSQVMGQAEAIFHVNPRANQPATGRVKLHIHNDSGATIAGTPMTVGVPFPRGVLSDPSHVRLVDESGHELPLQTRVTGKWTKFGSIQWLLCDFTVELTGQPRDVFLEYGPQVRRQPRDVMTTHATPGQLPSLMAGRIKLDRGVLLFDAQGNGDHQPVLDASAFHGAFVQHENGRRFVVPASVDHVFEELGSEKAILRRTGWYVDPHTGDPFCQFVTRMVFHRDSPVVRLFHTWIFTGDGNRDRIASMGWRFNTASSVSETGILSSFEDDQWLADPSLVQFDYNQYLLRDPAKPITGRAPGVLQVRVRQSRVTFGSRDFWQTFPNELAIDDTGFTFYNWPSRNPPATFKRPVGRWEVFRSRFAHEGKLLDFQLPEEYAQDKLWQAITRNIVPLEHHLAKDRVASVNAQGIARTEEMFLYFTPTSTSREETARVMRGLNDETLRATVDPDWAAACDIYDDIAPRDDQRFATEEELYEIAMLQPMQWVERLGFYGKWLHGDYATWNMNLPLQRVDAYRSLRKAHHGFPYRWIPYFRSGDPRLLKLADNAARHMIDANFCHYASADVDAAVGPDFYRRQGLWYRCFLPWAGKYGPHSRSYTMDCDYLWDAYHMTGNARMRDVLLLFGELTKQNEVVLGGGRHTQSMLKSYLDMYQATFDPWFLNAFHEVAQLHLNRYGQRPVIDPMMLDEPVGVVGYEHWRQADNAFYNYTGSDAYRRVAQNAAMGHAGPMSVIHNAAAGASGGGSHQHLAAAAWRLSGNPLYLGRLVAILDHLRIDSYTGPEDYLRGINHGTHGSSLTRVMLAVPRAMAVLSERKVMPDPVPDPIWMTPPHVTTRQGESPNLAFPIMHVLKREGEKATLTIAGRGGSVAQRRVELQCDITGPQGWSQSSAAQMPRVIELDGQPGTYAVQLTGDARVFFPLTLPQTPEVFQFTPTDKGIVVPAEVIGFHFFVPKGVESFWIQYTDVGTGLRPTVQAIVWNSKGQIVWEHPYPREEAPLEKTLIRVPEGESGKVWRATGGAFVLDPVIPPYFSLTRAKWFDPTGKHQPTW